MGQADHAADIHYKITPELAAIALDTTPGPAVGHQLNVHPNRWRAPRTHQRPFESERAISGSLRVQPQIKGRPRFIQPGSCERLSAEADDHGPRVAALETVPVAAQLCHMLAAGQSTQVAQEDEQRRLARLPGLGQLGWLSVQCRQGCVRSGFTDLQCHRRCPLRP